MEIMLLWSTEHRDKNSYPLSFGISLLIYLNEVVVCLFVSLSLLPSERSFPLKFSVSYMYWEIPVLWKC